MTDTTASAPTEVWYYTDDDVSSSEVYLDPDAAKSAAITAMEALDPSLVTGNEVYTWRTVEKLPGCHLLDENGRYTGWSVNRLPVAAACVMPKTPLESLADVEAFVDGLLTGDGDSNTIRRYARDGVERKLTDADLRAVIAIAKLATGPSVPAAGYPGVWAELTGYVQAAAEDNEAINAADLLAYLQELKRKAQEPVQEWMASVTAGAER